MMRLESHIKGYDNWREDPITYLRNHLEYTLNKKKVSDEDRINIGILLGAIKKEGVNEIIRVARTNEPFRVFADIAEAEENIRTKGWKRKVIDCDMVTEEKPWFAAGTLLIKLAKKYYKGNAYTFRIVKDIIDPWEKNNLEDMIHPDLYEKKNPKGFSNNELYKWTKGWEFNIDPLRYKNLKNFMRARVGEQLKYKPELIKARLAEKRVKERKIEEETLEKERILKLENQKKIEKLQEERYTSLDSIAKDPAVYVICEKRKTLTTVKNKCNALYVGETLNIAKRASAYQDLNRPNNELVNKLKSKLKKPQEYILKKLYNNVRVRILRNKTINNDNHRQQIEGYLIGRLNPLLNTSKRSGFFKRSFIEKKLSDNDYWEDVEDIYRDELYEYGDSETIYHVGDKKFVKRNSEDGEEAMEIQFQRSFKSWIKKHNLENRIDEWRENTETFWESIL